MPRMLIQRDMLKTVFCLHVKSTSSYEQAYHLCCIADTALELLSCLTSSQDNCLVWCGSLGDIAQPVARNQMAC